MFSIFKHKVVIKIRSGAATKIHDLADKAKPIETGGLLLGWWDKGSIVIDDVVEVADATATSNSWIRHQDQSQQVLNGALEEHSSDLIGYVGDWHCHPAHSSASSTDITSLRRASLQYKLPLVHVVRLPDDRLEVYVAKKGRSCRVEVIRT